MNPVVEAQTGGSKQGCVWGGEEEAHSRDRPPDVRPKEPLVIGIGRDTGAQEETADAKPPPPTFQPGQEPAPLLVKEQ